LVLAEVDVDVDGTDDDDEVEMDVVDTDDEVGTDVDNTDDVLFTTANEDKIKAAEVVGTAAGGVGVEEACAIAVEVAGGCVVAAAPLCGSLGYQIGTAVCGSILLKWSILLGTVFTGVPSAARIANVGL